ncbi:MAG: lipopolysaccharide heptosyltransferase I [Candidatus Woesearchaeota archaeon]|nr:MAG: lipopolysaccharide heptosyltransferase I [Candidatus Woesearchaeota archaeon]
MDIIIVKTGALGDVLRTTVILEGLIEKFVSPRIYWLTSRNARALLDNNPFIEKLFFKEDPTPEYLKHTYDLVISLEEDKEILMILSKVKRKKLFGLYLSDDGRITYIPRSSMWQDMELNSRFGKEIADCLKRSNLFSYPEILYKSLELEWKNQRYRLFLTKKDLIYSKALKDVISYNKPVIGVVVGSGGRWPMKVLPVDRQIELIKGLHKKYGYTISILLLTGTNSLELVNTENIKNACPYVYTHDVQDIEEFIGIVHLCDIVITPDTLSMHISIALSKYTIAYFTVTSAAEIEIYTGAKILANHPDYCNYTNEMKARPNVTDAVDIDHILSVIEKLINKHK